MPQSQPSRFSIHVMPSRICNIPLKREGRLGRRRNSAGGIPAIANAESWQPRIGYHHQVFGPQRLRTAIAHPVEGPDWTPTAQRDQSLPSRSRNGLDCVVIYV